MRGWACICAPSLIALGVGACLVSFEDYPAAGSDGGAGTSGSGGVSGGAGSAGAAAGAGVAGEAGSACVAGDVAWMAHYGVAGDEHLTALASSGSETFVVGNHAEASTFGGFELPNAGLEDVFIGILNAKGQPTAARSIGSPGKELAMDATSDAGGNWIVAGIYTQALAIDTITLPPVNGEETFIAKFSADIDKAAWATPITGTGPQLATAVAALPTGDVVVALDTDADVSVQNVITPADPDDVVVVKLAAGTGERMVARSFGDGAVQSSRALAVDEDGSIYLVGVYEGVLDGALPIADGADGFIVRLAGDLSPFWGMSFTGADAQQLEAVSASTTAIWVGGAFASTISAGTASANTPYALDGFVAKISPSGDVEELVALGAHSVVRDVRLLEDGGVTVVGEFQGTLTIGANVLSSSAGWAWFVARYDAQAQPLWATSFGSAEHNRFPRLAKGGASLVVMGGGFHGDTEIAGSAVSFVDFDSLALALCP